MHGNVNTEQVPSRLGRIVEILERESLLTEDQIQFALRVQARVETSRTLLEVIKRLDFITQDQIKEALRRRPAGIPLGDMLVQLGYIEEKDLRTAENIATRQNNGKNVGDILLEHHLIDEPTLLDVLSICLGIDYLDLEREQVDANLVKLAPSKWYETHRLVPVRRQTSGILVAFADPLNSGDLRAAQKLFGQDVIKAVARKESIGNSIKRAFGEKKPIKVRADSENSATQIVDTMVSSALEREASDIHIEPLDDRLRIRFRQDGVLYHFKDFPSELIPPLTNRIKVLCSLDITEKRRHQGGRFLFEHEGAKVDLRVSFYVTVYGEKIVLRLLNRKNQLIKIEDIGISPKTLKRFKEEALCLPTGVLLITGPTGSGKTSTVYSCIQHINNPSLSIITAEEPVEYIIRGVAQCSINPKISLTFEETLRHIVRQDPDVIVIGEIRDKFSAEVAVQAALTGHKVLTTFHTEDSIGGLVRLLNMNIEAFLISSTVISVMAQRLLRKVCPACGTGYKVDPAELNHLGYTLRDITNSDFRKGKGCELCQFTGYKGRTGVFELLVLNEVIRDAIIQCRTSQEIRNTSVATAGLVTLLEDGIYKAATGLTTIEEVLRCLPRLHKPRPVEELRRLLGG